MNVSNVSSCSGASAVDSDSVYKKTRTDFQTLADALQSGDINSAQQAFAQLQKDNPRLAQALSSPASSTDTPRIADLKSLAAALKTGDVSASQQAFSVLKSDAKVAASGHHHHHHHAAASVDASTTTDPTSDSTTSTGSVLNASA